MHIVILTPLPLERDAVIKHLQGSPEEKSIEGDNYEIGRFAGRHQDYQVVVHQSGSRNSVAAMAADKAVRLFQPAAVLLVGVAGGVKDAAIGDVVVATRAYGYESGKETPEGFKSRPQVAPFSRELLAVAQSVERKGEWKARALVDAGVAQVFFGPIASGDKVIASTQSPAYRILKDHYNDTLALEMESIGFGEAMLRHPLVQAINIRGVSDLLDGKTKSDKSGAQPLAAGRAAAFAFELLYQLDLSQFKLPQMDLKPLVVEVVDYILLALGGEAPGAGPHLRILLEKVKMLAPLAFEDLQSEQNDADMQASMRAQLQKALKDNETTQRELAVLLEKIKREKSEPFIEITNSRNIVNNSSVNAGGNIHIGDLHIHNQQATPVLEGDAAKRLRELISKNQIERALEELRQLTAGRQDGLQDEVDGLARQWNKIGRDRRMGTLSFDQENVAQNRITAAMLEVVAALEKA